MSDSELSEDNVSDAIIEEELRHIIRAILESGNFDELTVKRVRAAVEQSLKLRDGFLKGPLWKDRSKAFIEREVDKQEEDNKGSTMSLISSSSQAKSRAQPIASKRSTEIDLPSLKRRKISSAGASRSSSHSESDSPREAKTKRSTKSLVVKCSENDRANTPDIETTAKCDDHPESRFKGGTATRALSKEDSSKLSDVIDEGPKSKREKQGQSQNSRAKAAGKKGRPKQDKSLELDPAEEEIKRLKGWLTKCGIRKMWWKELRPHETPQAKIRHLKNMLSQAGMTGRYSIEKANQIREARELAADLEAVQAGNKNWGKSDRNDGDSDRPRRRIARGLEGLDFLIDDDGEETD